VTLYHSFSYANIWPWICYNNMTSTLPCIVPRGAAALTLGIVYFVIAYGLLKGKDGLRL
jgi:hypothetical protein